MSGPEVCCMEVLSLKLFSKYVYYVLDVVHNLSSEFFQQPRRQLQFLQRTCEVI